MNKNNTLAEKILLIRERSSFTQEQLATLINTSVARVSIYELGEGRPRNDAMRKLMEIGKKFDVEFDIYDMLSAQDFKEKINQSRIRKITGFSTMTHLKVFASLNQKRKKERK